MMHDGPLGQVVGAHYDALKLLAWKIRLTLERVGPYSFAKFVHWIWRRSNHPTCTPTEIILYQPISAQKVLGEPAYHFVYSL